MPSITIPMRFSGEEITVKVNHILKVEQSLRSFPRYCTVRLWDGSSVETPLSKSALNNAVRAAAGKKYLDETAYARMAFRRKELARQRAMTAPRPTPLLPNTPLERQRVKGNSDDKRLAKAMREASRAEPLACPARAGLGFLVSYVKIHADEAYKAHVIQLLNEAIQDLKTHKRKGQK